MSRFLTVTHSGSMDFRERKKAIRVPPAKVGRVTLNFVLVVLICLFAVVYIIEVNNVATKGYEIRDLEKKAEELKEGNEKLRIREAELRSMYNIEEKTKELNMTIPRDISYLSLPGSMAMK